jgi:hypothetical protein
VAAAFVLFEDFAAGFFGEIFFSAMLMSPPFLGPRPIG